VIRFERVTKKFGEVTALKEITFSVGKGEFVFLTGPSAAGKTTIIKLILAEIAPTEGEVFLAGEKIVGISRGKIHSCSLVNS
jgi:cell division transport system ATP-binding protein